MKRLDFFMGAIALAAVFMAATNNLNAQENGNRDEFGEIVRGPYETNRFSDNWFIGAGGGINILLNDGYDVKIGPSLDVNFGKWFTPSIGMRAGYQGLNAQTWADNPSILGADLDTDKGKYNQKLGYMYIHGDFLWNISNALSGYKETRFWNLVPYLHAGFFRSYGLGDTDFSDNEFAMGGGLLHNLRLTDRLDLIIDMRATVVNGRIHESSGAAVLPSVTMGLAVDLGWPNFVRTSTVLDAVEAANAEKFGILETAIIALEAANLALENDNASLKKQNTDLNNQVKALKKEQVGATEIFEEMGPMTLYFQIGKTVLNNKELQHLDFYATSILREADKDSKICITVMGSADSNTGSKSRNAYLSEARGKYVMNLLTGKYGISKDRIQLKSEVVKAASQPEMNRSVIITL